MFSDVAGFALLVAAALSVMRAGAKRGSGPSTTMLAGAAWWVDGVAVLTMACVPAASQASVRVAIGLAALPGAEDIAAL